MRLNHTVAFLFLVSMYLIGCTQPTAPTPAATTTTPSTAQTEPHDHNHGDDQKHEGTAVARQPHDHSGWWCDEHGVPEEVCALCNSKVAADFQKKGDWCQQHNRPNSQCFVCNPALADQFAAQYEAKYGKMPPKPTE